MCAYRQPGIASAVCRIAAGVAESSPAGQGNAATSTLRPGLNAAAGQDSRLGLYR